VSRLYRITSPATGVNLGRGFSGVRRPFGYGAADESGNPTTMGMWRRPLEAAYFTATQVPLIREAINLAPTVKLGDRFQTGPVSRYETGYTYMKPGGREPLKQWSRPVELGKWLSPVFPSDDTPATVTQWQRDANARRKRLGLKPLPVVRPGG
jgi:hypothetical protein